MLTAGRVRAVAVGAIALVTAAACTPPAPPSSNTDGSVPQAAPLSAHGMTQEGSQVWTADFLGSQLVRFDPNTGVISERHPLGQDVCNPDDVVVVPGGDLVATCPTQGVIMRVHRGGTSSLLAFVGTGVNPIALDPSGTSVLVGFTYGLDHRLLRVPLDGSPVQTVASGLPALGGFGFGPDGLLYVPTGGTEGALNAGGVGRINVATGAFTQLPLSFPGEPGKVGLDLAIGADVAADGTVFVAQSLNVAVYSMNPTTGVATSIGAPFANVGDNLVVLSDGRVIVSGFSGGGATVFTSSGAGYTASVRPIGV